MKAALTGVLGLGLVIVFSGCESVAQQARANCAVRYSVVETRNECLRGVSVAFKAVKDYQNEHPFEQFIREALVKKSLAEAFRACAEQPEGLDTNEELDRQLACEEGVQYYYELMRQVGQP